MEADGPTFLTVGGVRLECRWIGPGPDEAPTIVFLHEGLGSVSTWRDFPMRLAEATGCGALVYSRAGYGRSEPVELPRPVEFMHHEAKVLDDVLRAASVRRAVLFGHSDGASIALIHAASRPSDIVAGLVLEAPHVFVENVSVDSITRIGDVYRSTDLRERLARHHQHVDVAFGGWKAYGSIRSSARGTSNTFCPPSASPRWSSRVKPTSTARGRRWKRSSAGPADPSTCCASRTAGTRPTCSIQVW
ncbi:alpha/beta hydrolase [Longimicrobium sp.]|jgi:pimeloyl-ACP methyl ester carboxylesterase|uniref:alpha/beta fold hydrolase n=1 Tax=Longimicrobium sp. TaxID=2029185 RepID=UPI002EDA4F4B